MELQRKIDGLKAGQAVTKDLVKETHILQEHDS
jgi:hypothetical protein